MTTSKIIRGVILGAFLGMLMSGAVMSVLVPLLVSNGGHVSPVVPFLVFGGSIAVMIYLVLRARSKKET